MQTTIRRALPAVLSGALVLGALAVPVIAQEDDSTATEAPSDDASTADGSATDDGRHGDGALHALGHLQRGLPEDLVEDLAAELGITTDELRAAVDAVTLERMDERLDEAVADGRLTQDQADRLAAAAEAGELADVGQQVALEQLGARLDEQVAAGELTREQADARLAAAEAGEWRPGGRRGHHGPRGRGGAGLLENDATTDEGDGTVVTPEDTSSA